PEAAGERVDRYLAAALGDLSRTAIARLAADGHVRVGGVAAAPSRRLRAGEEVSCEVPAPTLSTLEPENIPLAVLHEDDEILVVDKPAGMVVHPGAGRTSG